LRRPSEFWRARTRISSPQISGSHQISLSTLVCSKKRLNFRHFATFSCDRQKTGVFLWSDLAFQRRIPETETGWAASQCRWSEYREECLASCRPRPMGRRDYPLRANQFLLVSASSRRCRRGRQFR
jgi:hypothetical protein